MAAEGELLYIPMVVELPEVMIPATLHITVETWDFLFLSGPIIRNICGGIQVLHAFYTLFHVYIKTV